MFVDGHSNAALRLPSPGFAVAALNAPRIGQDKSIVWVKLPPETKREWGTLLAMDAAVVETVTAKWAKLGLPGAGAPVGKG